MGIQGLLPLLRDITHRTHVSAFSGKRAAIDGYSWLYKGAYSCPLELCEDKPTDAYVKFCMSRIRMLLHHGVIPLVVFDGDKLPAKAITEDQRQSSRRSNKERGRQLSAAGHTRAALDVYQKALEATPQMARTLIEALKEAGVQFCVAPYEADAQMAHLALTGRADIIITEDSDLLAYGCPDVLFKLDKTGECDHVRLADLPLNRTPSFAGLDHDNFIEICVLAGCDFVASVPGMGVKKAHAGVRRFRSFLNVVKAARLNGGKVPRDYEVEVQKAYWTFRHQRVWDTEGGKLAHLHAIPGNSLVQSRLFVPRAVPADDALDFLGPVKPDSVVADIAAGNIDPMTHRRFVVSKVNGVTHVTLEGDAGPAAGLHQRASAVQAQPLQALQPSAPAAMQQHRSSVPAMFQMQQSGRGTGTAARRRASAPLQARTSAPASLGALPKKVQHSARPSKQAQSQTSALLARKSSESQLQRKSAEPSRSLHLQQQQQQQTSSDADTDCSAQAQCNGHSAARATAQLTADALITQPSAAHKSCISGLQRRTTALPNAAMRSAGRSGPAGNARVSGMLGALQAQLASAAGAQPQQSVPVPSTLLSDPNTSDIGDQLCAVSQRDEIQLEDAGPCLATQCSVSEGASLLAPTDMAATQSPAGAGLGVALSSQIDGRSALSMLGGSRSLSMSLDASLAAAWPLSQSSAGQDAGLDDSSNVLPPGQASLRQAFKAPRRRQAQLGTSALSADPLTSASAGVDSIGMSDMQRDTTLSSLATLNPDSSISDGQGASQQLQSGNARPLRNVLIDHDAGNEPAAACASPRQQPAPLREVLGHSNVPASTQPQSLKDKLLGLGKRRPDSHRNALVDASNRNAKPLRSLESCRLTAAPTMSKFKKPRRLYEV